MKPYKLELDLEVSDYVIVDGIVDAFLDTLEFYRDDELVGDVSFSGYIPDEVQDAQ